VVDIEERALGALEHYALLFFQRLVEENRSIADIFLYKACVSGVFPVNPVERELFGAVDAFEDGVLLFQDPRKLVFKDFVIEQVDDPYAGPRDLVGITRPYPALCGAYLLLLSLNRRVGNLETIVEDVRPMVIEMAMCCLMLF